MEVDGESAQRPPRSTGRAFRSELPVAGHWKLLDGWSANAPPTLLTMWQNCGPKACIVKLQVGVPQVLIVVHGTWDKNPAYTLPLSGPAVTTAPWLMFGEGKDLTWSNGDLVMPSYEEFKSAVQKALDELAKTGDCTEEYLPPGYVKPVKQPPDAGSTASDVESGWQLKDAQLPVDTGGKKAATSSDVGDGAPANTP